VIVLERLGRTKETIKNLKRLQDDVAYINIVTEKCGLKNVIIGFENGMSNWKIPRISEGELNLFSSFAENQKIFFKRQ